MGRLFGGIEMNNDDVKSNLKQTHFQYKALKVKAKRLRPLKAFIHLPKVQVKFEGVEIINSEDLKSIVRQISYRVQYLQEEASRLILPDDIPSHINEGLQRANELSDELPQKQEIIKDLKVALNDYRLNDMQQVRLGILRAIKRLDDARHYKWVLGAKKKYGQNAERLRAINEKTVKPKHEKWQKKADEIKLAIPRLQGKRSKSELARRVKEYFDAYDSKTSGAVGTIRNIFF
jgi:hypothetical protein